MSTLSRDGKWAIRRADEAQVIGEHAGYIDIIRAELAARRNRNSENEKT